MLELAYPKSFQAWMRVRRLISQHSTYPRLFSWPRWETDSACPIPKLFNPNESKRAQKMLELAYPKSFQAWMRIRRLISQHSTYLGLFSWPRWEPDSARPIPKLFNPNESKRAQKMLELAYPKSFQAWMRIRRLISQHSTYLGLFSRPRWEPDSARPIPELFNPDESKRAEKMLELALSHVFSGLDESKRLLSQHSTYPRLFSCPRWELDSAHPISELFNLDQSKRSKKVLELALS
jgi:hypothetical protein